MNPTGLSSTQFGAVFPFHFALDSNLKIFQTGPGLARLCPNLQPGACIADWFHIESPAVGVDSAGIRAHLDSVFVLRCLRHSLVLRGQMFDLEKDSKLVFLGSPQVTAPEDLTVLGLAPEDFPLHDSFHYFSESLRRQAAALEEARRQVAAVSERQRELEAAKTILSAAIEQCPASVMITDLHGAIEYVNTRLMESTGYTLEDLKGQRPSILIAQEEARPERSHEISEAVKNGGWRGVMRSRRKNGELFWESVSIRAITDDSGQPTHRVAVAEDITERLQMEQRIGQLAAIVECADTAIVSTDLSGTVLTWNRGAERIYGYSASEMIGQPVTALVPEERQREYEANLERLKRGETVNHLETVRLTKSGGLIHVLLTVSPVRNHYGRLLGTAALAWDITQIKQLQRQLAEAQRLESIGQLAAGIAHEINTPIQYIGDNARFLEDSFLDLIRIAQRRQNQSGASTQAGVERPLASTGDIEDGLLEYLQDEVPKAIGQLIEGVDQVARIVRAMKEFAHPGPVEKTPIDLNRAIESAILLSTNEWKYVADITTEFDLQLPPVACVAGEFNQVILNLIVNAAHAIADVTKESGEKGTIRISTSLVGDCVEIRVSDTGCGIPEGVRPRVFDPFFTTKPVGKGTGQGLAIAHSVIVHRHGGAIYLESEVGRGTTFYIQLPLACELEAA